MMPAQPLPRTPEHLKAAERTPEGHADLSCVPLSLSSSARGSLADSSPHRAGASCTSSPPSPSPWSSCPSAPTSSRATTSSLVRRPPPPPPLAPHRTLSPSVSPMLTLLLHPDSQNLAHVSGHLGRDGRQRCPDRLHLRRLPRGRRRRRAREARQGAREELGRQGRVTARRACCAWERTRREEEGRLVQVRSRSLSPLPWSPHSLQSLTQPSAGPVTLRNAVSARFSPSTPRAPAARHLVARRELDQAFSRASCLPSGSHVLVSPCTAFNVSWARRSVP